MSTKVKVLLGALILLAAALLGFYFGYWIRTPKYALGQLQEAINRHDTPYVEAHIDTDRLFGKIFDETIAWEFGPRDGSGQSRMNPALEEYMHSIRPVVVPVFTGQARHFIVTGRLDNDGPVDEDTSERGYHLAREMAYKIGMPNLSFSSLKEVEADGDVAIATLTVHDRQLDADLPLKLRMERKNGEWVVTETTDFPSYLKARRKAILERLDKLNAPLREKIAKAVRIEEKGDKAPVFSIREIEGSPNLSELEAVFTLSNIGDKEIISLSGTLSVADPSGIERFAESFEANSIRPGQSVTVHNAWPLSPYIPDQSILAGRTGANLKGVFHIQYVIFSDGSSITLMDTLPEDEGAERRGDR